MIVIAALDDDNGMMFNHRRQSRDIAVRKKIEEILHGNRLLLNSYSVEQFTESNITVCVNDDFLCRAGKGDFCFVENVKLADVKQEIEKFIIFRWNRKYPGDFRLDVLPWDNGFVCTGTDEFKGNSHEKITMEVWGMKDETD